MSAAAVCGLRELISALSLRQRRDNSALQAHAVQPEAIAWGVWLHCISSTSASLAQPLARLGLTGSAPGQAVALTLSYGADFSLAVYQLLMRFCALTPTDCIVYVQLELRVCD